MSCWNCDCGWKNCDTDDCLNPKCPSHRAVTKSEALSLLNEAGLDGETIIQEIRIYNGMVYDRDQINFHIFVGENP